MAFRISMSPPPDGVFFSTPRIVGWTERTYRLYSLYPHVWRWRKYCEHNTGVSRSWVAWKPIGLPVIRSTAHKTHYYYWKQAGLLQKINTGMSDSNDSQAGGSQQASKKRKRTLITQEQTEKLEKSFQQEPWPNRARKEQLAKSMDKNTKFVSTWFQNKRARLRREEQYDKLIKKGRVGVKKCEERLSQRLVTLDGNFGAVKTVQQSVCTVGSDNLSTTVGLQCASESSVAVVSNFPAIGSDVKIATAKHNMPKTVSRGTLKLLPRAKSQAKYVTSMKPEKNSMTCTVKNPAPNEEKLQVSNASTMSKEENICYLKAPTLAKLISQPPKNVPPKAKTVSVSLLDPNGEAIFQEVRHSPKILGQQIAKYRSETQSSVVSLDVEKDNSVKKANQLITQRPKSPKSVDGVQNKPPRFEIGSDAGEPRMKYTTCELVSDSISMT